MAEEKMTHNTECKSELHHQHLCYMVSQGFHISDAAEYNALVEDPKFRCKHCGRAAKSADSLCEPTEL